jgi:hypothetical protein
MAAAVGLDNMLPSPSPTATPTPTPHHTVAPSTSGCPVGPFLRRLLDATICAGTVCLLGAAVALSAAFLSASHANYPGGVALQRLIGHHIAGEVKSALALALRDAGGSCQSSSNSKSNSKSSSISGVHQCVTTYDDAIHTVKVHIDVAAAMTGVTRFGQDQLMRASGEQGAEKNVIIEYSKTEGLASFEDFDWLITDDRVGFGKVSTFETVEEIPGFKGLKLCFNSPDHGASGSNSNSASASAGVGVGGITSTPILGPFTVRIPIVPILMHMQPPAPIRIAVPVCLQTQTALYILRKKKPKINSTEDTDKIQSAR